MKRRIKDNYVRLPMDKAYNVRDLGGYAGVGRKQTRFHAFVRTDDLSLITDRDQKFLKAYGVTAALDLRAAEEAEAYPNPFKFDSEVDYANIPFITDEIMDMRKIKEVGFHVPVFYRQLVDSHDLVRNIIRFILKQKGCVLFHCQAGKDRTGIVAMILLGICGVAKQDIIANYQVTRTYLKDYVDLHLPDELKELEYSEAQWMEETYEYLIEKYGTFENYLLEVGFSASEIKKLRRKLI